MYLLSSDSTRVLIFFLLTWHLYSAFQLCILSEVRLLNFLRQYMYIILNVRFVHWSLVYIVCQYAHLLGKQCFLQSNFLEYLWMFATCVWNHCLRTTLVLYIDANAKNNMKHHNDKEQWPKSKCTIQIHSGSHCDLVFRSQNVGHLKFISIRRSVRNPLLRSLALSHSLPLSQALTAEAKVTCLQLGTLSNKKHTREHGLKMSDSTNFCHILRMTTTMPTF